MVIAFKHVLYKNSEILPCDLIFACLLANPCRKGFVPCEGRKERPLWETGILGNMYGR
jgi:hypothetical protein